MEQYELPDGWEWKRLGSICRLINGRAFKTQEWSREGLPIIRIQNLNNVSKEFNYYNGEIEPRYKVRNGDVLISWSGTPGTSFGAHNWTGGDAVLNQHIFRTEIDEDVMDKRFFASAVTYRLDEMILKAHGGVGLQHITKRKLEDILLPVPPLADQRRIVTRIEEITRGVQEAQGLQKETLEKADTLLPAAIADVFSDLERRDIRLVSEICEKPQYGYTQSATTQAIGPKFLRITDIQNGQVDWQAVPYCRCNDIDKYRLRAGDILFARTGATTGKSYLVGDCPEAIFASYLIRLRAKSDVSPNFLWWYFQSANYWTQVFGGIEVGAQPNMNGKKLAALKVPLPHLQQQHRIVTYLDSVRGRAEELRHQQQNTQAELENVIPSVFSKAFRGEL